MTKEEEKRVKLALQEFGIAEILEILIEISSSYNRRIIKFFRHFCEYFPICFMLAHMYGIYDISQNPRDIFISEIDNISCQLLIYIMVYVTPMIMVIASELFHFCWRFRIPFFYLVGVNAIHIAYGSFFTTTEMITAHIVVGVMILMLYLYGFTELFVNSKIGKRIFK